MPRLEAVRQEGSMMVIHISVRALTKRGAKSRALGSVLLRRPSKVPAFDHAEAFAPDTRGLGSDYTVKVYIQMGDGFRYNGFTHRARLKILENTPEVL